MAKKKTKEEIAVKKSLLAADEAEKQYLTKEELDKFDIATTQRQLRKEQQKNLENQRRHLRTQMELLECKLLLLDHELLELSGKMKDEVEKHRKWFEALKEKYNVPQDSGFGHDPVTGEIVIS